MTPSSPVTQKRPDPMLWVWVQILSAAVFALTYSAYVNSDLIFLGKTFVSSGDGALILAIHEHYYSAMSGIGRLMHAPYFYPYDHSIGLTDTFAITGTVYSVFRFAGWNAIHSFQLVFVGLPFVCLVISTVQLKRLRYVSSWWLAILIATLICNNFAFIQSGVHLQLGYSLLAIIALMWFFSSYALGRTRGILLSAMMLGAIFSSAIYVGWYSLVMAGLFVLAWTLIARESWHSEFKKAIAFAGGLIPGFLLVAVFYLPPYLDTGGGNFMDHVRYSVNLKSLFEFGNLNLASWLVPSYGEFIPEFHERSYGIPFYFLVSWIFMAGMLVKRGRHDPYVKVFFCVSISMAMMIGALYFWFGDVSVWTYVTKIVPAANNLRAYGRAPVVLLPVLILILAVGLTLLERERLVSKAFGGVFVLLLIVGGSSVTKRGGRDYAPNFMAAIDRVKAIPVGCQYFSYIDETNGSPRGTGSDEIAMFIAVSTGLPTIDGRLGSVPPGWSMRMPKRLDNGFLNHASYWIHRNRLDPAGYCLLDHNGEWTSGETMLPKPYEVRNYEIGDELFAKMRIELVDMGIEKQEGRFVTVRIRNQGQSEIVPMHENGESLQLGLALGGERQLGFDRKIPLFDTIPAEGFVDVRIPLETKPVQPVEISIVRDRGVWLHRLGVEPLRIAF